jgi:hypothetical protein
MRRATLVLAGILAAGCARFGWSDRVLITAPAPSRALVFVCQEIPEFDGPGYQWRLESRDGAIVRRLFTGSDGNGKCDHAVWSDDGATLAIVVGGTIHVADVAWAMAHPEEKNTHWFVRQFSYGGAASVAEDVRFQDSRHVTFTISGRQFQLAIPTPIVPGRRT